VFRKIVLILILLVSIVILWVGIRASRMKRGVDSGGLPPLPDAGRESAQTPAGRPKRTVEKGPEKFLHQTYDHETGLVKYICKGEKAFRHADGTLEVTKPEIIMYGRSASGRNEPKVNMAAAKGLVELRETAESTELVSVIFNGDVLVTSLDKQRPVKAAFDDITWERRRNLVSTDGPVKIWSDDFEIKGRGFFGDSDLREIKITKSDYVLLKQSGRIVGATGGDAFKITCTGTLVFNRSDRFVRLNDNVVGSRQKMPEAGAQLTAKKSATIYFASKTRTGGGGLEVDRVVAVGDVQLHMDDRWAWGDTVAFAEEQLTVIGSPGRIKMGDIELTGFGEIILSKGVEGMEVNTNGKGKGFLSQPVKKSPGRRKNTEVSFEKSMAYRTLPSGRSIAVFEGNVRMVQKLSDRGTPLSRITGDVVRLTFDRTRDEKGGSATELSKLEATGRDVFIKWGTLTSDGNRSFVYDRAEGKAVFLAKEGASSRLLVGSKGENVLRSKTHEVRFGREDERISELKGDGVGALKWKLSQGAGGWIDAKWSRKYWFGFEGGKRIAKFFGDVKANQGGGGTLTSDELEIYFTTPAGVGGAPAEMQLIRNLETERFVASGSVCFVGAEKRPGGPATKAARAATFNAWADHMDYATREGEPVKLSGNVRVTRGKLFQFEGEQCNFVPKTREASSESAGTVTIIQDGNARRAPQKIRISYGGYMYYMPATGSALFVKDVIVRRTDLKKKRLIDRMDCRQLRLAFGGKGEDGADRGDRLRWITAKTGVTYVVYMGSRKAHAAPVGSLPSRLVLQGRKFFSHEHYSPDNLYVFCDTMEYQAEGEGRVVLKPAPGDQIVVLEQGLVTYKKSMEIFGLSESMEYTATGSTYLRFDAPGKRGKE